MELPVWRKNGNAIYTVPIVLARLSDAEKMLIQKISPFVPLHHMKDGTMGCSGHVCAFEQDIEGFVTTLPRSRSDVTMLRVLKTIKSEVGNNSGTTTKMFRVRKQHVIEALLFLKEYHTGYKDIVIDRSKLDWIEGEEGILDGLVIETDEIETSEDHNESNADIGPAPDQCCHPNYKENISVFGYHESGGKASVSESDQIINEKLQEAVSKSPKKRSITVDWPSIQKAPVDEFGDTKLFSLAFPWLFPGKSDIEIYETITTQVVT